MKVSIITIGDELLMGQVVDTNSAWLGAQLNNLGYQLKEILTVSDDYLEIMNGINYVFQQTDIILMTGGLGPTKDDITRKAIADYYGVEMVFHEETHERIKKMFHKRDIPFTDAHKLQCYVPSNATILNNDMGTAPGILIEKNGKTLISMPGVPFEMKFITENHVLPFLKTKYDGPPILHLTIRTCGLGESSISDMIQEIEDNLPAGVKLAYLPDVAQVRLRYSVSGLPKQEMESILSTLKYKTEVFLGDYIYGYGDTTLEETVGTLLIERNMRMVTCESCTGGYLAHKITSIPGCSANYYGSFISYANEYKTKILHVQQTTLEAHGAVSEETVKEMVKGGIDNSGVDIAVAISGIAGPDGQSPGKPVGLVWIAVGNHDRIITRKYQFTKDRLRNIEYASTYALILLRKFILEIGGVKEINM